MVEAELLLLWLLLACNQIIEIEIIDQFYTSHPPLGKPSSLIYITPKIKVKLFHEKSLEKILNLPTFHHERIWHLIVKKSVGKVAVLMSKAELENWSWPWRKVACFGEFCSLHTAADSSFCTKQSEKWFVMRAKNFASVVVCCDLSGGQRGQAKMRCFRSHKTFVGTGSNCPRISRLCQATLEAKCEMTTKYFLLGSEMTRPHSRSYWKNWTQGFFVIFQRVILFRIPVIIFASVAQKLFEKVTKMLRLLRIAQKTISVMMNCSGVQVPSAFEVKSSYERFPVSCNWKLLLSKAIWKKKNEFKAINWEEFFSAMHHF